ncbi:MAG: penicillin-binding protein 2 [Legionellales bacterium]|nr:penicillin-binding protein 2 [Legionellales bacterium]
MLKPISTLKNHLQEMRLFNNRIFAATVAIIILCGLIVLRLVYLQIFQHGLYTTLSQQNQLNFLPLPPKRGLIYDRNGVLLAENIPVFTLECIPDYVPHLSATIAKLRQLIQIDEDDINEFYKLKNRTRHFQSVALKLNLSPTEVAQFETNQYLYPGCAVHARLIRYYPLKNAVAHVVGYVGRINEKELQKINDSNYDPSSFIGKTGIEQYYESTLHGQTGYEKVETDASGRILRVLQKVPAVAGDNLYLSIDSNLQQVAEKAFGNNPGALIAINPQTGEILAFVSNPSFDPNLFVNGISASDFKALQTAPDRPLYNRAIRGQYPMASTIKPYLGLEGLESGTITPQYTINDPGYYILKGSEHIYHDWYHRGHGLVNLTRAITVSCDTFFYNLSHLLGIQRIDDILHQFGYGQHTGIDLNDELTGLIASPEWKRKRFGKAWYPGDTVNAAIGQGYMLTTPLQLADAVSAVAMRGQRFQPHLVMQLQPPNQPVIQVTPVELPMVHLHDFTWYVVINAMRQVIESGEGTGYHFGRNPGYEVAAKTGTAQVYSLKRNQSDSNQQSIPVQLRDHSLFIAFAPVDDPKIAIAVVAEHSTLAAAIARQTMDYYLLKEKPAQ